MSLDVSPNGEWLVFDMLGDVYVLPSVGGKARKLTSGTGWNARPVWSPDGSRVAFISDREGSDQVFVVDALDGRNPVQVTGPGQLDAVLSHRLEGEVRMAEWMPDSRHILVGGHSFPIDKGVTVANGIPKKFAGGTGFGSPGGLYYFEPAENPRKHGSERGGAYNVWRARRDGLPVRMPQLSGPIGWGLEPPAISADGRWLVYRDRSSVDASTKHFPDHVPATGETDIDSLRVRDARTGTDRVLVGPGLSPGWRSNGVNAGIIGISTHIRYAISPDSRFLFVSYGGQIRRIEIETGVSSTIPMSVDVERCLSPMAYYSRRLDEGGLQVRNMRGITKSPDGRMLVFSALRRLYVQNMGGNGSPRLFNAQEQGQFEPVFSPDGKWVAYVTWDDRVGGHLWRATVEGDRVERLTGTAGYYRSPVWSPDGATIAMAGSLDLDTKRRGYDSIGYGGRVITVSVASGEMRVHPQELNLDSQITFSADGGRLYFSPYIEGGIGSLGLHSILLDGTGRADHAMERFFQSYGLMSAAMHPDGTAAATIKFGNLYLVICSAESGVTDFTSPSCREIRVTGSGGYDPKWREEGRVLEWSFANSYFSARFSDLLDIGAGSERVAADTLAASGRLESRMLHLEVPRRRAAGMLALKGARVITMRGDEVLENATLILKNGRISEIGHASSIDIPQGVDVIELQGKTIMPGLIDAHAHFNHIPRGLLARNHWEPLLSLAYGVTTIKNPSNGGDHAFSYAELVDAGQMVGPRMFGTPGLVSTRVEKMDSLSDAMEIANRYSKLGATFVKYHTGFSRHRRQWIIEAAESLDMNVAAHLPTQNYSSGRINLSTVVDGATSMEHEISDASDMFSDVREFLLQSGVGICMAPINAYGGYPARYWVALSTDRRMQRFYKDRSPSSPSPVTGLDGPLAPLRPDAEANAKFVSSLAQRSQQVMIGSHGDKGAISMHLEMWAHARGGMTPHQVLRAATLNGARGLGLELDLGSLEVGKVADLIVLDKNPLDDIRNTISVELVMKDGVLRDAETLDETWPQKEPLPEWRMKAANDDLAGAGLSAMQ